MRRAVFLDRDGVLNQVVRRGEKIASPRTMDEFILAPGVGQQVSRLRQAGFLVLVATNQPDIARGKMDPAQLELMHRSLAQAAPVHEILVCPHDDADGCPCRKPLPGLLTEPADRLDLDLAASYMVGDSWKDMAAARAAGVTGLLLEAEYNQEVDCDLRLSDLAQACDYILLRNGR